MYNTSTWHITMLTHTSIHTTINSGTHYQLNLEDGWKGLAYTHICARHTRTQLDTHSNRARTLCLVASDRWSLTENSRCRYLYVSLYVATHTYRCYICYNGSQSLCLCVLVISILPLHFGVRSCSMTVPFIGNKNNPSVDSVHSRKSYQAVVVTATCLSPTQFTTRSSSTNKLFSEFKFSAFSYRSTHFPLDI